jgi:hypothetical protein
MRMNPITAMKGAGLVLVTWAVISAAAPPVMAQSCCRCDTSGVPTSCLTGPIPDQAACELACLNLPNELFGQFQTCPPGTVMVQCSQDPSTLCDITCTPAAAPVPTTSTTGTLLAVAVLVGFGAYRLRRYAGRHL